MFDLEVSHEPSLLFVDFINTTTCGKLILLTYNIMINILLPVEKKYLGNVMPGELLFKGLVPREGLSMEDLLESQLKHEISAITKRIDTIMENIQEFEPDAHDQLKQGENPIISIDNA